MQDSCEELASFLRHTDFTPAVVLPAARFENCTPLHCAALRSFPQDIEWLLQNGSDPNAMSTLGERPQDWVPVCKRGQQCKCVHGDDALLWGCHSAVARNRLLRANLVWRWGILGFVQWLIGVFVAFTMLLGFHSPVRPERMEEVQRRRDKERRRREEEWLNEKERARAEDIRKYRESMEKADGFFDSSQSSQAYYWYSEAAETLKDLESDDPDSPRTGADSELFGAEFKSRLYARYAICAGHSLERENVEEVYQEALERLKDCGNVAVVCRWFAELLVSFAEVTIAHL
jgi:hypothetical protein